MAIGKEAIYAHIALTFMGGDGYIKKIWNLMVSACLVVTITLSAAFMLPKFIGLQPYVVTSGSMEPKYPVGSLIYVENVEVEEISVGEAITFYLQGSKTVATHQVYEIDRQHRQFRTQGINNRDQAGNILHDALPVDYDSVIGRPLLCIPYLGIVNRFCTTAPGNYVLISLAVFVAGISFLFECFPEKKFKKNK